MLLLFKEMFTETGMRNADFGLESGPLGGRGEQRVCLAHTTSERRARISSCPFPSFFRFFRAFFSLCRKAQKGATHERRKGEEKVRQLSQKLAADN